MTLGARGGARRVCAALGVAALALAITIGGVRCRKLPEPPNVLVLVMDTTRADRCSFLGYEKPTTPELTRLAGESVVFTDAWSPGSWTLPAHAALFTGRRPVRLGVVKPALSPLRKDATTLAEVLSGSGWSTGLFTCNGWLAPYAGLTQGFEKVDPVYIRNPQGGARVAHRNALEWMRERQSSSKRFFACINDVEPHSPWDPPAETAAKFASPGATAAFTAEARGLCFPRTALMYLGLQPISTGLRDAVSDLYDAEIATLDAEIGSLLREMRAAGLLETTFIVVVGDHGEGLNDHGSMEHGLLLHRELLRVPLLIRPPGGTAARTVDTVVRLEDIFPTVLDACAVPVPGTIDGVAVLGVGSAAAPGLVARAAERARLDLIIEIEKVTSPSIAAPFRVGRRSVYDGRHHLIADDRGRTELYDVKSDPAEKHDLSATLPDVVAALRAQLDPE